MAKYKIIPSSRTIVQSPISIGHKAEKGVEAIEFDVTAWVETYGSGTLTVIMRRWGDAIPYPIALEIDENNKATWTLSDTDTAKAGMAYAQLSYVVGETVVKKSDIYTFRVMDSLTGEGEPPEAYESWLEQLTHLAAEAMAEVLDIEGIVTDKTLTVDGGIADAKATGDALALKADKSTTYTKTEVDQMIEDVEVETDTTLEVAGAAADAAETGRQIGLLKADLGTLIKYGALDLNLSNVRAAYPAYVVNSAPTLTNSKTTLTFLNALKVKKGKKYTLKMTNGASPASASSKHSVIVADNKVVQVIETAGTAGTEIELDFEPVVDGDLYIVVDCLFASLEIDGRIEESKETETEIPKAVKTALLGCLEEYAYSSTTGRTAFNALRNALGVLDDLNVTYTQSGTIYDSDTLDTLKSDLTVEAVYIDGTTETVTDYTLSGNLTAGTSKIMVSYLGMSKEISVTVTAKTALYHWNFKESLTDTVANKEFTINTTLNASRSSLGLFYWGYREGVGTCAEAKVPLGGKAVIKFGAVEFVEGGNNGNGTIISGVIGYAWRGPLSRYAVYNGSWSATGAVDKPINYLSGKTLILSISSTGNVEINVDGEVVAEIPAGLSEPYQIAFGETTARQTFRNMVIESLSIYGA